MRLPPGDALSVGWKEGEMRRLVERRAGLDVHKKTVTACVRVPARGGERAEHVATFGTTTAELLALRDWLSGFGVTLVGMESTGVYWKPVYYVLEDDFECWLINAQHLRNVPGRKTDVAVATWICQLLEHGLVRPSFVPPKEIRDLRDLTRYRKVLINERGREAQRLEKVLQDAGVKLSSVATNILGVSGRAMLSALAGGTHDPAVLAELAKGVLRRKLPELREALEGRFRPHHALIVGEILSHIDYLEEAIERLSEEVGRLIAPFDEQVELLDTIPGVNRRTAEVLLAEIGPDMSRFPTHRHLASWAGLCPGNNESAGKRLTGKTRKGSKWLRTALIESGKAAARSKGSYFAAHYSRIKGRRGHGKATVAVAHSILVVAYHVLDRRQPFADLGADYLSQRDSTEGYKRRLVRQLERLGHTVTLGPIPTPACGGPARVLSPQGGGNRLNVDRSRPSVGALEAHAGVFRYSPRIQAVERDQPDRVDLQDGCPGAVSAPCTLFVHHSASRTHSLPTNGRYQLSVPRESG